MTSQNVLGTHVQTQSGQKLSPTVRLVVPLNQPSHFAFIPQSTYLGGQENFAFILSVITGFENDYTG